MKFFVAVLLTATLAFIGGLYLPWWSIAIAAFITAVLVHQRSLPALLAGFLGIFLLWGGLAWWIDMNNDGVLSAKMAKLLPLNGSAVALMLVTAFVGGLVGAFAAMTGSYLRYPPLK